MNRQENWLIQNKKKDIRILIVEDEALANLSLKKSIDRILGDEYNVATDTALDDVQAYKKAGSNKYDIILMDIDLKKGDNGDIIAQKIRNDNTHLNKGSNIISMTAYPEYDDRVQFPQFNGHIQKPYGIEEVIKIIRNTINNSDKRYS